MNCITIEFSQIVLMRYHSSAMAERSVFLELRQAGIPVDRPAQLQHLKVDYGELRIIHDTHKKIVRIQWIAEVTDGKQKKKEE